jgi:hypothetical protein
MNVKLIPEGKTATRKSIACLSQSFHQIKWDADIIFSARTSNRRFLFTPDYNCVCVWLTAFPWIIFPLL